MDDSEAWLKWPKYRKYFDKLWLSMELGYHCGPCGLAPDKTDFYIVRPIYNLSGMGVGAKKVLIKEGNCSVVQPGYFWCEWFDGEQYSATYRFKDGEWKKESCFIGMRKGNALSFFDKWVKTDFIPDLPDMFKEITDLEILNVEFIGDKPIEVHLRESPDPDASELIPVWKGQETLVDIYSKQGYNYIDSYDDADGFLNTPRIGFLVKGE